MKACELPVTNALSPYAKTIHVIENNDAGAVDILPFYANGYPGLMYQISEEAMLLPKGKALSTLFLYGQTILPIQIRIQAPYKIIVFELHPFVVKLIFDVNPKELNDDCYDFLSLPEFAAQDISTSLQQEQQPEKQIDFISSFLEQQLQRKSILPQQKLKLALDLIFFHKGAISVKRITEEVKMNERTLQRLFIEQVGVSPKQFSKIIQFQHALQDVSDAAFQKLTDVVYENGYADQSHFIREFKKYAGHKPSQHKKKK